MMEVDEIRKMIRGSGVRTVRITQGSGHGFYWKTLLDIHLDLTGKYVKVKKKKLESPDELLVLLWIRKKSKTCWRKKFYLLSLREAQNALFKQVKEMVVKHNGLRPKNPFSEKFFVYKKYLETFKMFEI